MNRTAFRHHSTKYVYLDTHQCRACWKCIEVCTTGVIGKVDMPFHKHARIEHPELCKGCQKCVKICPENALKAYPVTH